jgi:flagellar biosynthesis protein FlhG
LLLEELDACTAQLDFVLVDTGAGLSDNVLYFNLGAQERLVVADQEPASVINAYTLIKVLAGRYAQKRFQLLFNKITRPREARRSFEQLTKVADRFLRGAVALEYLGVIPEDDSVPQSVSEQSVLVKIHPHSPAALAFAETARALLSRETNPALDGNIKFFWQSLNRQAADSFSQGDCHASQ